MKTLTANIRSRARLLRLVPMGVASLWFAVPAFAATSVSQFGITWSFSQDRTVGQFANGDWWVIGPVTITGITPEDTNPGDSWDMNGTMVNPMPTSLNRGQGFDSSVNFGTFYDNALNVAPKNTGTNLAVPADSSVVSSISVSSPNTVIAKSQFEIQAILTVVASAPPAGSLRPPPTGAAKIPYWNKSSLNYGILQNLTATASALPLPTIENYFERPWLAIAEGDAVQAMSPKQMPNYGRDAANLLNHGLLTLHLNYTNAQKEKLYIKMVQYGIDVYGSVRSGMNFRGAGGLNNGRKVPMVLAGLALNDASILAWSDRNQHNVFGEDKQAFYVTQADVDRPRYTADGRPREPYTQAMIGMPEWGEQHEAYPNRDASNWGSAPYRWIGGSQLGNVLMAHLTAGGVQAWNHQPLFAYSDRYWEFEKNSQTFSAPNNISPFVYEMWAAYRWGGATIPPTTMPPPLPAVTFAIGDRIETLKNTNVRALGSLLGTLLGVQSQGSIGTIVGGPVQMDNVTWWQVNYDNGADGWSGGDNFIKSTHSPTPLPSAPIGLKVVE